MFALWKQLVVCAVTLTVSVYFQGEQ